MTDFLLWVSAHVLAMGVGVFLGFRAARYADGEKFWPW